MGGRNKGGQHKLAFESQFKQLPQTKEKNT